MDKSRTPEETTWPGLLSELLSGADLTREQTDWAMDCIMRGDATAAQIAGFLVALRSKGESVPEVTGLVDAMVRHAVRIEVPGHCVDVVGTGGDRAHTVNISTMAALVVAGAGCRVVKHGNRAASSACGSADVLEALGVRLDLPSSRVAQVAVEAGITFCFAQLFHPSMRHAAGARRELGIPTAFNVLGPLTNPAAPQAAAVGVGDRRMAPVVAGVLAGRGTSALVFRGEDGLDELTTAGPSSVWEVSGGGVVEHRLDPAQLGIPTASASTLRGGDVAYNARVVHEVLAGQRGPVRHAVLLNAAAGLVAADAVRSRSVTDPETRVLKAEILAARSGAGAQVKVGDTADLTSRMAAAVERATAAVDSGAAAEVLERWVAISRG
ncbi:MAG: anthranilate phosphoribosyltransferase [Angustibacter sp.]